MGSTPRSFVWTGNHPAATNRFRASWYVTLFKDGIFSNFCG